MFFPNLCGIISQLLEFKEINGVFYVSSRKRAIETLRNYCASYRVEFCSYC